MVKKCKVKVSKFNYLIYTLFKQCVKEASNLKIKCFLTYSLTIIDRILILGSYTL